MATHDERWHDRVDLHLGLRCAQRYVEQVDRLLHQRHQVDGLRLRLVARDKTAHVADDVAGLVEVAGRFV